MRKTYTLEASFDRPANTTTYSSGDGVSDDTTTPTILTFAPAAKGSGFGGKIVSVYMHKTDQDASNATFDLCLFDSDVAPAGFNDNAAVAVTDPEWQTGIHVITLAASDSLNFNTGNVWRYSNLEIGYQCASGDQNIYGFLVARGAYDPASAETFTIRLTVEVD